ncbi:MAG: Ppx/GppA family phosphatase [Acidobacteriia bacterium]|nr:Ppx/GppA family phosphatase [Terriglobia bacterium]
MLAAEASSGGAISELASDRQVVRLGTGVFREGRLSTDAMNLACQVMSRMAEQYRSLDVLAVRAVGTSALRDASNQAEFLERAEAILGTPVEVVSGLEEARLVHLGVHARWPLPQHRVLIVDIGGGSAELIMGEHGHLTEAFSKPLGAVRLTELFLKSDPPDPKELARMQRYVQKRLLGPVARFGQLKIDRMIATSATASAVVCAVNRVRRSHRDLADRQSATAPQVRKLFKELCARNLAGRSRHTGIGPRRAEIVVAGVHVLSEIMEQLRVPRMYYSAAGVREGIIADLVHRKVGMEQVRLDLDQRRMVRALGKRYGVTAPHARKVAELAAALFEGLHPLHRLPPERGRLLEAAAYLHNIGHFVNETRHHRHSMYLVANSDLAGFDNNERKIVANLCRYHRKSMPQVSHEGLQELGAQDRRAIVQLTPLLRLAVALDQSQEQRVERLECISGDESVEIRLYSGHDIDIEQWHAQQVSGNFQEVYGLPLIVKVKR